MTTYNTAIPASKRFLEFLVLRENMRKSRESIGGPGPHSPDPILANHHFCNINREHDAVTKFIHEKFRIPFASRGVDFMVRQMLYCRIFNEPATLSVVCPLEVDTFDALQKLRQHRIASQQKIMRGAYMMPPHGKSAAGQEMIDHWLEVVDLCTMGVNYDSLPTLADVAQGLMRVCGIGDFISNQVCTDLRYVPDWGKRWIDWGTFILAGPGTRRGLNRYHDRDLTATGDSKFFTADLLAVRDEIWEELDTDFRLYFADPNNLSNSFCEFDKWERGHIQLAAGKEVTLRHYKGAQRQQSMF